MPNMAARPKMARELGSGTLELLTTTLFVNVAKCIPLPKMSRVGLSYRAVDQLLKSSAFAITLRSSSFATGKTSCGDRI